MLQIPGDIAESFEATMRAVGVADAERPHLRKWLRYYLDFCVKYGFDPSDEASFPRFNAKLREKGQAEWKRRKAFRAVGMHRQALPAPDLHAQRRRGSSGRFMSVADSQEWSAWQIRDGNNQMHQSSGPQGNDRQSPAMTRGTSFGGSGRGRRPVSRRNPSAPSQPRRLFDHHLSEGAKDISNRFVDSRRAPEPSAPVSHSVNYDDYRAVPVGTAESLENTAAGASTESSGESRAQIAKTWIEVFEQLEAAVVVRHYSPKTLKSYRAWARKFQGYTHNRAPSGLSTEDVKAFLSSLAIEKRVSASTQNQAFNALLFLFRHVLGKEFGKVDGVVRAKKRPYIPVVLSRQEVDGLISCLGHPYDLVSKLLYGCGLRLFECLKLRVQDISLESMVLTVHDGKGKKDRTVPLPRTLRDEIERQLELTAQVHRKDLADSYAGTFLPTALGAKYKNAARELPWKWLFPAKTLTVVPDTEERRRFHLHESHVQKAIKQAVQQAGLRKRALCATAMPAICCRPTSTSAPFRSCWDTATSGRR